MAGYTGSKFPGNADSSHCATMVESGFAANAAAWSPRQSSCRSSTTRLATSSRKNAPYRLRRPAHIDLQGFRAYLQELGLDTEDEPQPNDEDDLRNRGVLADLGGVLHPTLYGVLAFGKEPQLYPQTRSFRVECASYQGDDRASNVLQVADTAGRLDEQVRRALGWFSGLGRFESYRGLIREDRPLLPQVALREALVNSVVHRDYAVTGSKVLLECFATHVDVTSPGGLPNHMRVESVRAGGHPRSRNESMANYMLVMGFMEQRGRGWPVMRRAMREFNGTEPEIIQDESGTYVRVRFHLEPHD